MRRKQYDFNSSYTKKGWKFSYSWQTCCSQTPSCSDRHVFHIFQCTSYSGNNPRTNFSNYTCSSPSVSGGPSLWQVLWAPPSIPIADTVCLFLALSLSFCLWEALTCPFIPLLSHMRQCSHLPRLGPASLRTPGDRWDPFLRLPLPHPNNTSLRVWLPCTQLGEWAGTSWSLSVLPASQSQHSYGLFFPSKRGVILSVDISTDTAETRPVAGMTESI